MLFEILKTNKKADVWLIVMRIRKQALKTSKCVADIKKN